jgi:WD40 repeat protein
VRCEVQLVRLARTLVALRDLSARAWTSTSVTIVAVSFTVGTCVCMAKAANRVRVAWQTDIEGVVLQDVSRGGLMLTLGGPAPSDWSWEPRLELWPDKIGASPVKIPLSKWPEYQKRLSAGNYGPDLCKFVDVDRQIACTQGPWVTLVDIGSKKEIRRVTGTEDLGGLNRNALLGTSKIDKRPSSPVALAVDPKDGRIAVAYNTLRDPKILLFSSNLRDQLASWQVHKYVQDLFWSPDGSRLGVLYFNYYDGSNPQGKWTGWHPERDLAGVPDVSIFDARTGKQVLNFASAGVEAKAAFSPDGKLIYVITSSRTIAGYSAGGWAKDTLRAFSSTTGKLVRTFKVSSTGVRNNFAVSPDGRFIAAECNKNIHSDWYYMLRLKESLGGGINAGFVILDSSTGRVIFREKQRTGGSYFDTLPLFFSPKSRLLIAELGPTSKDVTSRLVAYAIAR